MAERRDIEQWMIAINSHIHMVYVNSVYSDAARPDFWDEGEVETTFWKVPAPIGGVLKRPVGIRSHPSVFSPRTGEGVFPGETVEVLVISCGVNGNLLCLTTHLTF
jgi:hypothetical protein